MQQTPASTAIKLTNVKSLKTKADREQLLEDVRAALATFELEIELTPYSSRHFVATISTPYLRADVDFEGDDPNPSMIHWHNAHLPLQALPGVWVEDDINPTHRMKATSYPETYTQLVSILADGFSAAFTGAAFQPDNLLLAA